MKIIPLSLFFAGITLFSCSNESTNNLSTNSQKVKLNKNEVLSIAYVSPTMMQKSLQTKIFSIW